MTTSPLPQTISEAVEDYLYQKSLSRSRKTAKAYRHGLNHFCASLQDNEIDPDQTRPEKLAEPLFFLRFIERLQELGLAASTQKLYANAVSGFYKYLTARALTQVNLNVLQELSRQHLRRTGQRLPQFPKAQIEQVIEYALALQQAPVEDKRAQRLNLRDRAFILTLADTGLRVHEACALRRGDLDWNEGRAVIIGKGDKQAVVRFSERALLALKEYLQSRRELDAATGQQLTALPLFARHDDGGERQVKPISTETGRNIIKGRVQACLGEQAVGAITPHSFRHYFVTTVLQATGGDIHLAQRLARHSDIGITQRYAHLSDDELDRGYHGVFNQQ
jgi:site-specific recombinase XerD